jgi:hypothetical protein
MGEELQVSILITSLGKSLASVVLVKTRRSVSK